MKERKKLYKAGKLWVTATLVAFAGIVVTTTSASADNNTVVATPQTSQVNSSVPAPSTSTATPADATSATQNTLAQPANTAVSYAAANTTSWETTTSTLNGPTKLPSNQVQNPRNYTIGVYRNETLIYTYHPQLGDLFITNQAGQVVSQPTTAGTYRLQLSQQGLSNMRRVPDLQGYTLQSNVTTTIQLYQLYTPNTQDYQQNYGSLDGYSIRQTSATEAAIHVAGWHASGASSLMPYGWLIVFDNTRGREIKRVAIDPVNRPDVQAAYRNVYGSLQSGFNQDIIIPLSAAGDDLTIIARYSSDFINGEGQRIDHWFNRINADHAGFSVDVPLLPAMVTDNIQFISRYSSTADSNRDYVDYWFAPQQLLSDHRNQGYLDSVNVQNGKLHIAGWHATNQSIGRPYHTLIILNAQTGHELLRYTTKQYASRPDLTRAFPGIVTAGQSGFNVDLQLVPGMGNQPLQIVSRWSATQDANSNYVDYWFAPVTLYRDTANRANLDRFAIQGNVIYASGWHATSQSLGRPYHYLFLFDRTTNREVQRVKVTAANSARPDVARAFPGTYNAGQSGFNAQFTVQPALNGHELVVLSRWTDDPAGNGNAVDYWFGQTVTPNVPVDKAKQLG